MSDSEMVERVAEAIRLEQSAWRFMSSGRSFFGIRCEPIKVAEPGNVPESQEFTKQHLGDGDESSARKVFDYGVDRECARAAIAAMREPTAEMLSQADSAIPCFQEDIHGSRLMGVDGAKDCWHAMIDAALAPNPPAEERGHDDGE